MNVYFLMGSEPCFKKRMGTFPSWFIKHILAGSRLAMYGLNGRLKRLNQNAHYWVKPRLSYRGGQRSRRFLCIRRLLLRFRSFPDFRCTIRAPFSIASTFPRSAAELVKIDPQAIGWAQYQSTMFKSLSSCPKSLAQCCRRLRKIKWVWTLISRPVSLFILCVLV